MLQFRNVSFNGGDKTIIDGVSFGVFTRDFISIMGPSGSGKSTILRLCSHLISPTEGSILFKGKKHQRLQPG